MKPKYSGDKSAKFWAEIAKVKNSEVRNLLYMAGCALQDHEHRVLKMVASALTSPDSKGAT